MARMPRSTTVATIVWREEPATATAFYYKRSFHKAGGSAAPPGDAIRQPASPPLLISSTESSIHLARRPLAIKVCQIVTCSS